MGKRRRLSTERDYALTALKHRTRVWAFAAATVTLLLLSVVVGGGQGSLAEMGLSIPALGLIVWALIRLRAQDPPVGWVAWVLPVALLGLPIVQLIPLPPSWVAALPGRAPLLADLAVAGVSMGWHPLTLVPLATERMLLGALVPVALYLATLTLDRVTQRRVLWVMLGAAVVSTLVGFWQVLEGPASHLYFYTITNLGEAVGFFANRNHLAAFEVAMVPVAAGLLADRLQRASDWKDTVALLLAATLVLLAVGVTGTRSRAGGVLLMVSVVSIIPVLIRGRGRGDGAGRFGRWLRGIGAVALVAIVQYTLLGMLSRIDQDPLDDLRWTLAARSIAAARDTAGVGWGLGSFTEAYGRLGEVTADMPQYVNHAHNDYLELWMDGGLPAVLVAAALVMLVLLMLVRRFREPPERYQAREPKHRRSSARGMVLGAGLSLVLLALHSIVDYPLRTTALASVAAVLLAILLAPRADRWRGGAAAAAEAAEAEEAEEAEAEEAEEAEDGAPKASGADSVGEPS